MSKITIDFQTNSASFEEDFEFEVAEVLSRANSAFRNAGTGEGERITVPLRDTNGNKVGSITIDRRD